MPCFRRAARSTAGRLQANRLDARLRGKPEREDSAGIPAGAFDASAFALPRKIPPPRIFASNGPWRAGISGRRVKSTSRFTSRFFPLTAVPAR